MVDGLKFGIGFNLAPLFLFAILIVLIIVLTYLWRVLEIGYNFIRENRCPASCLEHQCRRMKRHFGVHESEILESDEGTRFYQIKFTGDDFSPFRASWTIDLKRRRKP